jgi:hypothetical protein
MLKACIVVAAIGMGATTSTQANPASYQPNESASNDVFIYEFNPPMTDLNAPGSWGDMLPAMKPGSGHELQSLIHFDLSAAGITSIEPGETALLQLYSVDITASGFGKNPSASYPLTVDLFANDPASTAFTEATKWPARPTTIAPAVDSETITGINGWVSFDVTAQIQAWLANPSLNEGFTIIARDVVNSPEGKVGVLFNSSNKGATAPILTVVPEPTMLGLLAVGALFARRRVG